MGRVNAMRLFAALVTAAVVGCLATSSRTGAPEASGRIVLDFGKGWRWHLGDAPDGPGYGSGALAGFVNRSKCTNMQPRDEWAPTGDKSAGQPWTSCAVACSYNPDCTAFEDSTNGRMCLHGFNDTVCTGDGEGAHQRGPDASFQRNYSFARRDFEDGAWRRATLPHDPLINQTFDPNAGEGSAFLPRKVVWYRKHFSLPESWRGKHVFVYLQGAFQYSQFYLNGAHIGDHNVGYTSFTVRLDNASGGVSYGDGGVNVLAVRVDPTFGSGWWYEGGGINRPLSLVATPPVHFVQGGVFVNPNSNGSALKVHVEIDDASAVAVDAPVTTGVPSQQQQHEQQQAHEVQLALFDSSGQQRLATASVSVVTGAAGASVTLVPGVGSLRTWSPQTPATYVLASTHDSGDAINVTVAARTFEFGNKTNLNGRRIELNGFSHHPSFAGMGAQTSPRLALFLVQTAKALGVNTWRNSHNPYEDAVYEMLTTLGVICWDENRNYGSDHAPEYRDMIKAHRGHAAVAIWGLCNEGGCGVENGAAAEAFLRVKNELDPDRPQTGNMVRGQDYNFPYVDLIAQSGSADLAAWHAENPGKPITTGEHGFGNNQLWDSRGPEDRALVRLGPNLSKVFSGSLGNGGRGWGNLRPKQTIPFLLSSHGLGMWAMMDYFGEAYEGWPTFVKSRGHLDVAGFPRSTAWWFRTNYLANPNVTNYQRPLVGGRWWVQVRALTPCQFFSSTPLLDVVADGVTVRRRAAVNEFGLVDLRTGSADWPPPKRDGKSCSITLLTNASHTDACDAEPSNFGCYDGVDGMWVDKGCRGVFLCNGRQTQCQCIGGQGFCSTRANCSCDQPRCALDGAKNVTAVGVNADGTVAASHTLLAPGAPVALELFVDVPSPSTGTGDSLFLDGQDVAFVRAQLVDANGTISRSDDDNVTFVVVSGPVRIVGVGSGSIRNHQPVQGDTYETWQGLARVVVQATVDCTGEFRDIAKAVDVDAPPETYEASCPAEGEAVLSASTSRGLSATVTLHVSGDLADSPIEVAKRTQSLNTYTYFEEVQP